MVRDSRGPHAGPSSSGFGTFTAGQADDRLRKRCVATESCPNPTEQFPTPHGSAAALPRTETQARALDKALDNLAVDLG